MQDSRDSLPFPLYIYIIIVSSYLLGPDCFDTVNLRVN